MNGKYSKIYRYLTSNFGRMENELYDQSHIIGKNPNNAKQWITIYKHFDKYKHLDTKTSETRMFKNVYLHRSNQPIKWELDKSHLEISLEECKKETMPSKAESNDSTTRHAIKGRQLGKHADRTNEVFDTAASLKNAPRELPNIDGFLSNILYFGVDAETAQEIKINIDEAYFAVWLPAFNGDREKAKRVYKWQLFRTVVSHWSTIIKLGVAAFFALIGVPKVWDFISKFGKS